MLLVRDLLLDHDAVHLGPRTGDDRCSKSNAGRQFSSLAFAPLSLKLLTLGVVTGRSLGCSKIFLALPFRVRANGSPPGSPNQENGEHSKEGQGEGADDGAGDGTRGGRVGRGGGRGRE